MSSVPLAALAVQPPQDPTQGLQRAITLRNLLQNQPLELQQRQQAVQSGQLQIQLQQQQVKDQQAVTAAWKNYDPSKQKPEDLIKGVLANGGSGAAANQLDQMMMARQQQFMALDKDAFELQQKRSDRMLGRFDAAKNVTDDQLADHVSSALQESVAAGDLKPQEAQSAYQVFQQTQGNPKAMRDALDTFEKSHMLGSQIASRAKEQAQTREANANAAAKELLPAGAEGQSLVDYMRTPPVPGELPHTPANYPAWKAKQEAIQTAPQKIAVAEAEGRARANIEAQTARGSNAALANVPPHLVAPASSAANKAGEDYAAAKSVSDRLNATMDAAKHGNVISYQIIPEEGTLQITTSQGVHRINRTEIEQYAGGGSLWQRLEGHFGRQLTGQSIPDSVLKDMAEIQKIQAAGAKSKYENSLKTINQTYGAGFKPVEMDTMKQPHSFTFNGQRYENVPDELYNKYKGQKGFSE